VGLNATLPLTVSSWQARSAHSHDAEMPRRQDAETPRRRDAKTPRRQDAKTPRRRDAETPRRRDTSRHIETPTTGCSGALTKGSGRNLWRGVLGPHCAMCRRKQ
jgi:hypothetical protein